MNPSTNPLEPKYEDGRSYLVTGGLLNALIRLLRLQNIIPGPGLKETGTPMGRVLTATGGVARLGRYQLYIAGGSLFVAPGSVTWVPLPDADDAEEEEDPPALIPVIPTLDGIPLNAETAPSWSLSGVDDGAVWLVLDRFDTGEDDPAARVELIPRDAEPEVTETEIAVMIAEFDLLDGQFDGLIVRLESDWEQFYQLPGSSSSSGSSDNGDGGGGGPGSDSGSGKDSAIVPASWSETGFTALFVVEAPDVRFEDTFTDLRIRGRESRYAIDPKFLEVTAPGSLRVIGLVGDRPYPVGARIEGGELVLVAAADMRRRPTVANVRITALRKGHEATRFPDRALRHYKANERRLNLKNYVD